MLALVDPYILAFSAITVVVTVFMGFWAARKSKSAADFFVAGRGVSVGWNASAISGEYLSAASFMGVAGMVMSSGYDALWYPVCYACGYLFLLLFIAGPLRRFGAYTIPDFAEGRYDSPVFRKIAVIFVLFIGFFYTMPQMKGAGTTLAYIFKDIEFLGQKGLPYWVGVVLVGAVITLNVALGGMKGITLVQAFQYWAKMFAISVPVFVLMSVYGSYGKQLGNNSAVPTAMASAINANPINDTNLWKTFPKGKFEGAEGGPVPQTARALLFIYHRYDIKRTPMEHILWAYSLETGFKISVHQSVILTNTVARPPLDPTAQQLRQLIDSEGIQVEQDGSTLLRVVASPLGSDLRHWIADRSRFAGPKDHVWLNPFGPLTTKAAKAAKIEGSAAKPYALLYTYSLIIALVCGTAGLPHILVRFYTNPDGVSAKRTTMWVMILIGIFYVFPPVFGALGRNLMPSLYEGAGVGGTDGLVLKLPTILNDRFGVLGSVLSGITCAGAFAAFMSTFSGLLVSMTGALAHDVYGRILRPKSTAAERMQMFKWCAVAIGIVAVLLGTLVENFEINFMVGQAFAIAAASYFPLLFMSVWWRGMTTRGAATGMLTGGLCAVAAISVASWTTFFTAQAAKFKSLGVPEPGWFAALKPYALTDFWAAHPLLRILSEQPAIWAVPLAITLMIVVSKLTKREVPADIRMKMLVLHAPEALGLKQEYIRDHDGAH